MKEIREKIIDLVGKFEEPYSEYYSHTGEDMWKWNYPLSKYNKDVVVLCSGTKSFDFALTKILEFLEDIEQSRKIYVDRFRPYRAKLSEVERNFYDNLYIQNKSLAMRAFILFYRNNMSSTDVFNYINNILIKDNLKISLKRPNIFQHPF